MKGAGCMSFLKTILSTFTNPNNWGVDNILATISVILGIIGGLFAYKQWSTANKTKRSEFINQIIEKLRFDKDMVDTMYMVDYDYAWYDDDFHKNGNELEYRIDKLLSYLSYICYLYKIKNIRNKDFCILKYEVHRVCTSPSVQSYLWNLYHFSRVQGTDCSFHYLIEYGIDNGLICETTFNNSSSTEYVKQLDF